MKCDIKKHVSDKYILEFSKKLIYNEEFDNGIPTGNYTSQYFANIYLDVLDKYIKQDLRCKSKCNLKLKN